MTAASDSQSRRSLSHLADNLRNVRQARGLKMKDLAERCDLTQGFISQVENGHSVPSVVTLLRMADALEADLPTLLAAPDNVAVGHVLPDGDAVFDIAGDERALARVLTHGSAGLQGLEIRIEPEAYLGDHLTHTGTDLIYMMSGELTVDLADHGRYVLGPRHALTHSGLIPHRWTVTSDVAAEFVCVVVPESRPSSDQISHATISHEGLPDGD